MRTLMSFAAVCAAAVVAGTLLGAPTARAIDLIREPEDMPEGPGRDTVFYMCTACHSMQIVVQQGLSRERWDTVLVWMVEEQGMAELDTATRAEILDYLETHYNEDG